MSTLSFHEFLVSSDSLWVYKEDRCLFTSNKGGILPLLEYIEILAPHHRRIIIFDKVVGNAAALLSVKATAKEVYSPLGSELAVKTLCKYDIKYHFTETVPYIQNHNRDDMCPMETLSIDKSPEEFFELARKQLVNIRYKGTKAI
jgi:hypothetical protein